MANRYAYAVNLGRPISRANGLLTSDKNVQPPTGGPNETHDSDASSSTDQSESHTVIRFATGPNVLDIDPGRWPGLT